MIRPVTIKIPILYLAADYFVFIGLTFACDRFPTPDDIEPKPEVSVSENYDLLLALPTADFQVGTIENGVVALNHIEIADTFSHEGIQYETISLIISGDIDPNNNSRLYIEYSVIDHWGATTSLALLVKVVDPTGEEVFGLGCPNIKNECVNNDCAGCAFTYNNAGCINGCTCTRPLNLDSYCGHNISDHENAGSSLSNKMMSNLVHGSSPY
ncbi:hypothetical protein GC167_06615 [bacterium]|nr:hypothetical protein [bacterium]